MTRCLLCGGQVIEGQNYYQVKKNGCKRGSYSIGFLCALCGLKLEVPE